MVKFFGTMSALQYFVSIAVIVTCLSNNVEAVNFRRRFRSFTENRNGEAIDFGRSVQPSSNSNFDPVMSPSSEPRPVFLSLFSNRRQPSSPVFPDRRLVPASAGVGRSPGEAISFSNTPRRPVNSAISFGNNPSDTGISFAAQPVISNSAKPNILITDADRRAPIVFGNPSIANKPSTGANVPQLEPVGNTGNSPKLSVFKNPARLAPIEFGNNKNTVRIESLVPQHNEVDNSPIDSSTSFDISDTTTDFFNPESTTNIEGETTEAPCLLEERSIIFNGVCHSLLEMGPCSDTEWVVLSDQGVPECKERECPWDKLFFNDSCIDPSDFDICPQGQIIYVDLQGNAECDCQDGFVFHPETGNCYTTHEQGICKDNFFTEFNDDLSVRCVENPCGLDNFVFHQGNCYKKNYVGYCEPSHVEIRPGDGADCVFLVLHSILKAPTLRACPRGSRRDRLQNCRAVFRIPTQSTLSSLSGECPFGFKKDQAGTCRRVFDLFGNS